MEKPSRKLGRSSQPDETQQTSTIWPEWNDVEVNATKWNLGEIKTKAKSKKSPKKSSIPPELEAPPVFFEDEAGILIMPSNMKVVSWIRPQQLFVDVTCSLAPEIEPLDLISQNSHLMKYEIMRNIISSIMCLEQEASARPFTVEFQNPKFIDNGGPYWKPWHHVYGLSKVGKGTLHNMNYNSYGLYIVRLFYMGKWRQIIVDDILPVDENNQILLPCSKIHSNIWLPILSKALIRVAALSQFREFSVVHCLTGWIHTNLNSRNISPYCLWHICCQLMPTTEEITGPPGCCKQESVTCLPDGTIEKYEAVGSRAIFAYITHITQAESSLPGLTPCWDHFLLINSARFNDEEPNPRWKEYRWKEWAYNKGLISDISPKPVRNVDLFSPFQKRKSLAEEVLAPDVSTVTSPKKKGTAKSKKNLTKKSKRIDLEKLQDKVEQEKNWIDFDQLLKYIRSIQVFYKPSFFEFQLNSFSIPELSAFQGQPEVVKETSKLVASSKKKDRTKSPVKSESSKKSRPKDKKETSVKNESNKKSRPKDKKEASEKILTAGELSHHCFYLITDSQFCKTFYISTSGQDDGKKKVITEDPFYVVGEHFNWRSRNLGEIIFVLKPKQSKSIVLKLEPGLQVLRIWYHFPKNFSFHIYSNSNFTTCLKTRMQELLACDSVTFSYYGEQISEHFKLLLNASPGGQEHGEAFTNFIHSFNPPFMTRQLCWPYWFTAELDLQQVFEESIIEMIVDTNVTPSVEFFKTLEDFKMLFLSPKFGDKPLENISNDHSSFVHLRRLSKEQKQMLEDIAKTLTHGKQVGSKKKDKKSISKSAKSPKSTGSSKQKGKSTKTGLIKYIQVPPESLLLTNPENAKKLMRLMMYKLPQLLNYYPLKTDDVNLLSFCEYLGEGNIYQNWVLLCRCYMNLHTCTPTPCSFHILAPVSKAVINIINRDTWQYIHIGTSENPVCLLSQNKNGYVVCVYGTLLSPSTKDFQWTLRIVGEPNTNLLHLCTLNETGQCVFERQLPSMFLQYVREQYIPNRWNIIGRCLIRVTTEKSVFLRLVLSSAKVQCSLKVVNDLGEVATYAEGVGEIILPAVILKGPDTEKEVIMYEVEIKLLNNSWPLSYAEKVACFLKKEALQNHEPSSNVPERLSQVKKKPSITSKNQSFDGGNDMCYWELILVSSQQKPLQVNLIPDTRLVDKLRQYLPDWSILQGSRLNSGHIFRELFRSNIFNDEYDNFTNFENKTIEDIFNFSPVKTTTLLNKYEEPLFELPDNTIIRSGVISATSHELSYASDQLLPFEEENKIKNQITHKHVIRFQERVHKTLAQYSQKEKEDCAKQMEEARKIWEQTVAEYVALNKKSALTEKPGLEKDKKKKKKK